ncbi:LapA family protein [Croceicoccus sp. YJ47]|uniref:LapA family protein n=1 Tax=Croceicoccus sp. YJ47 TaxID=2798724 RepID=UPI001920F5F3|nr:LapA family protein [Croceicoccus sp. YJ47]QQN73865.1 LapA family protein [Croceicoccus sp. YJ47]
MQVLRTIIWVALLVALALFAAFNWYPVDVRIWENLVLETKLPMVILAAFLIGLVPMWLYHKSAKWRLKRRIASLETSHRSLVSSQQADPAHRPHDADDAPLRRTEP